MAAATQARHKPRGSVARPIPTAFSACHAATATVNEAASATDLFTVATQGLSGGDQRTDHRGMNALDTSVATSSAPLARLTLTLGPEERRALAHFVALSGATSRPDALRELVARLSAAPSSVRSRLLAFAVPPLPADSSQSKRLDARIATDDRAAFERWCGDRLRIQDALRSALHLLAKDAAFVAELGYGESEGAVPAPVPAPRRHEPVRSTPRATRGQTPMPPPAHPRPPRSKPPPASPAPRRRRPARRPPRQPAWPPTPRTIPAVEVADDWETTVLLRRLKSGRADIQFAPAWTDEVEAAAEDLVELLGGGDSVTVVVGLDRKPWEVHDEDGDLVGSGHDWTLVPVPRPKSIAHDMLVSAHTAGGVDLEARVHRIDDESATGAIVELVAYGAF